MTFISKPEKSNVRPVRVMPSVEDKIKAHCGTLAQGLRNYAELLDDVNVKLKNLQK